MPVDLRKQLEQAVREARRMGEAGARAALHGLDVPAAAPHGAMAEEERALRRRLRAHGRQLGDRLRKQSVQGVDRLAHEVAYEHWHRMLFARFLAENGLLIEPGSGVAVTLEECAELARKRTEAGTGGAADGWSMAESFATRMLPEVFRPNDPSLEVTLAPESRQGLEKLVTDLPAEVFTASDSLGWTYQFWQADRKDEVNAAEMKIGADEVSAVTQLFTENYMVRFLFHNTVGAWRAARILARRPDLARSAASEAELTEEMRIPATGGLPAYSFEYLRFVREGEGAGAWWPAAGGYRRWPGSARELRVLDPCCGSGHFLVEALELLARLRMEEEGLAVEEAVRRVLQDNLFGLELDPRCTQIAVFSGALAAWRLAGRHFELPQPNVACSGVAVTANKDAWRALARGWGDGWGTGAQTARDEERRMRLQGAMDSLHGLFRDAPTLGSLIDPRRVGGAAGETGGLYEAGYEAVAEALERALRREDPGDRPTDPRGPTVGRQIGDGGDIEGDEAAADRAEWRLAAAGISRAAQILVGEYDLVITNVPYLAGGKQAPTLQRFVAAQHADAKADLATAFVSRGLRWLGAAGAQAVVVPQNWLFLKSYRKLRERLLADRTWRLVARLGPGAFETISGEVVNVALVVLSGEAPSADGVLAGMDVSAHRGERPIRTREKARLLRAPADDRSRADSPRGVVVPSQQRDQRSNPNSVVLLVPLAGQILLGRYTYGHQGIATADYACFGRKFWEMPNRGSDWEFQQSTVRQTSDMGGREHVLHWEEGEGPLQQSESVRIQGGGAWTRDGIAVSQMGPLPVTRYTGEYFDNNVAVLTVTNPEHLPAVWCFCSSHEYGPAIRQFDQKLNVTNANLVNAVFDLDRWRKVAAERYPRGLPEPYSDDPTQWLFHGHPCGSVIWCDEAKRTAHGPLRADANVLQIAAARLLGYRWPSETDRSMRLAAVAREWVQRAGELADFADADGIVCLHAAAREAPAAERLRAILRASYGARWSAAREEELLVAANEGIPRRRQARSLDDWLRDHFFAQHVKLFQNRPFVWHIWDGRLDGFHALVNCHRLCGPGGEGQRTLKALAFRHLGDWVARQRDASSRGEEGAAGRLAAARDLQRQLERILEGDPPCDLFIRWRPLHEQPIGWAPHLDDGVRLNIRPFVKAELQIGGVAGAGLLRARPNVKWDKADRGKEPASLRPREEFPWFYDCRGSGTASDRTDYLALGDPQYDGKRWNDLHYTRETKEKARASHEAGSDGRGERDA